MLNSLYGRLGLKPITVKSEFVKVTDISKIEATHNILEDSIINEDLHFITYDLEEDLDLLAISNENLDTLITGENLTSYSSIGVAAAITAYARMFMYEYKIKYKEHLYYSDNDSLVLDIPLPDHLVGTNLGQFEFEYKVKEAYFIAPK